MNKYLFPLPLPIGGINLIDDSLIADTEAAEGTKNISFKNGVPHTRNGYVKASLYEFAINPGTIYPYADSILAACGTGLKIMNGDTFDDITGILNSDRISCLTYPFKFNDPDVYGEKCFILDGAKYLYYAGGAALVDVPAYVPTADEITAYGTNVLTDAPDEVKKQRFILNDDERIWVAGYNNLVRISHLQRPDYFPSTQVWKLSEDCTGMARFMGEVMLFTEHTTTLITGSTINFGLPDRYIFKKLPEGYGCSQSRTIAQGDNAVFWANKDGVYRYRYLPSGYSIPECVSEFLLTDGHQRSIKKWLQSITDWDKVFAEYYDHEYRLFIGNKQVIVFDTINSTWTLYEYDQDFTCSMAYDNKLYYAAGYLYEMDKVYDPSGAGYDGLNDDGQPISYVLKSKFFDFGKAANKKKFKELYVTIYTELISYDIDLILNIDNDLTKITDEIVNQVSRFGQFKFGDKIVTKETNLNYPIKIHHKGQKYNIQYEMQLTGDNVAFTLLSMVLSLKIKELK